MRPANSLDSLDIFSPAELQRLTGEKTSGREIDRVPTINLLMALV